MACNRHKKDNVCYSKSQVQLQWYISLELHELITKYTLYYWMKKDIRNIRYGSSLKFSYKNG